jgi:hypothetical protein
LILEEEIVCTDWTEPHRTLPADMAFRPSFLVVEAY